VLPQSPPKRNLPLPWLFQSKLSVLSNALWLTQGSHPGADLSASDGMDAETPSPPTRLSTVPGDRDHSAGHRQRRSP
jgi:hypothetical protein